MIKKNLLMIGMLIFLVVSVSALRYIENEDGRWYWQADSEESELRTEEVNLGNLVILNPSKEPDNPEIGTVFFDENLQRLKLFTKNGWKTLAFLGEVNETPPENETNQTNFPEPLAEWRFDECKWQGNAGEVIDSSGNGFDGKSVSANVK